MNSQTETDAVRQAVAIWSVGIDGEQAAIPCPSDQNLLNAMIAARRTAIKVGCRSGGCGICRVKITQGAYASLKMSRSRISQEDEAAGIVLACRVLPRSDMVLVPLPLPCRLEISGANSDVHPTPPPSNRQPPDDRPVAAT